MRSLLVGLAVVATATVAQPISYALYRPLGLIEPDIPLDRPLTKEVVALGRKLFSDPRLSASGRTSCASCHNPNYGFADPRILSIQDNGVATKRHAQSVLNSGFLPTTTWDGKWRTLEEQVRDTFQRNGDMGHEIENAVNVLAANPEYIGLFAAAFGEKPSGDKLAIAIAQFERSLVSGDSPFDKHVFGGDKNALNNEQQAGLRLFTSKAGCINCHDVFHPNFNPLGGGTALFTDFRFHNLGVGYQFNRFGDVGRFRVTRDPTDLGAFRTPSLRNVALRPPYMHDGSLASLEEVVDFYNKGGIVNPNISPSIRPLYLDGVEKRQLVAFMKALSDTKLSKSID